MVTAISAIVIFLVVVLIHESGHFLMAKKVGIKVNEFSIGMGPEIYQKEKGETKYSLRLLPIGGYVSMEGEDDSSSDPRSFNNAGIWERIGVIVAGPIMNFILAIIILTIVAFKIGTPTTTIGEIQESSPAYRSDLRAGDKILEINGNPINKWEDITRNIGGAATDKELEIKVARNTKEEVFSLLPESHEGKTIIGIIPTNEKSVGGALKGGVKQTGNFTLALLDFFKMLFRGQVSTNDLSGPVGVVREIGIKAKMGIYDLLILLGFISVNLGFFNLLPIPALDGGRIFFLLIELLRGKPIDPDKEGLVHFIGFVILIGLMLLVTYKDILKLLM